MNLSYNAFMLFWDLKEFKKPIQLRKTGAASEEQNF